MMQLTLQGMIHPEDILSCAEMFVTIACIFGNDAPYLALAGNDSS